MPVDQSHQHKHSHAIGVDLGGTNLRVALLSNLDSDRGLSIARDHREKVGDARDPESIVARLAAIIETLTADSPLPKLPIGVGIAAMLRGNDGMVANSPHLVWRDVPFGELLRARLPGRPIAVVNDVNAVTYGEYARGAGEGAGHVLAVFFGTGIGGGIVADDHLLEGASNCAGEIGHTKVVVGDQARPCACGSRGCVEAYAGGQALLQRVANDVDSGAKTAAAALAGDAPINPGHIDQAAAAGDPYALALWAEIAPLCGQTLANAVTLLNPERLLLGGGMLSRTPVLRDRIIGHIKELANAPALEDLVIGDAALGDNAGLIGSALLAARQRNDTV